MCAEQKIKGYSNSKNMFTMFSYGGFSCVCRHASFEVLSFDLKTNDHLAPPWCKLENPTINV